MAGPFCCVPRLLVKTAVTCSVVFGSEKMHLSAPEYGENSNLEEREKIKKLKKVVDMYKPG